MTIKNKFILGYTATAVALGMLGAIIFLSYFLIRNNIEMISSDTIPDMLNISSLSKALFGSVEYAYNYPMTGNKSDKDNFFKKMDEYNQLKNQFEKSVGYGQAGVNPKDQELLARLDGLSKDYVDEANLMFASYERTHEMSALDTVNFSLAVEKIMPTFDDYISLEKNEALDSVSKIRDISSQSINIAIVVALFVGLFAGGIALFMLRSIVDPLKRLKIAVFALSHGDLSKRAEVSSRDEIGELASNFNSMADKLQKSQTDIKKVNITLRKQGEKMKDQLEELEKFQKLTVGRELKMMELKEDLKESEKKHGKNKS